MSIKPWRETAEPHEDVRRGTFQDAEFAADLSRVHAGTASVEYQDAALFFKRTFITEGMRLLLDSVVKRLAGRGGDPVVQLQTAFGGGKTHTMLTVYHLATSEVPASDLAGINPILDAAGVSELPRARVAVLDGNKLAPNQPQVRDGQKICTLWGDLAWQLGQAEGFAMLADADASGTSPGKEVLEKLLRRFAPCVILIDELVAYVRQFEEGAHLQGGTFDSNLSFVQALTESLKAVPNALLLVSLPQSDKEAGSAHGVKALEALSLYFGRVQALWKPVATEEAFEIVRRRLFAPISDLAQAQATCRAFADYYIAHSADFPRETQESYYYERLLHAYPIHPEVFDRLYQDWSSLDNFQRTRGVLKMMAKVIYRLWQEGNNDPLIMPGNLPLADRDTRNDMMYYLPNGWDPVLERDIDGERAETTQIENQDTRLGSLQACRRSARAIFLGSAPTTANQMVRGIEFERVLLGVVLPGQALGTYKDAAKRLGDRLHYLNIAQARYWFDTRPNLRREMEDRKRRFNDREEVLPLLESSLRSCVNSNQFKGVHIFASTDIADDTQLRLAVLPPDAGYSRVGRNLAQERALEILAMRGTQARYNKNRLLFLAPDYDSVQRLKDQARTVLAWRSIEADYKDGKLNLDRHGADQAKKGQEIASTALARMVRECYKWLMAPRQEMQADKSLSPILWENYALNTSAPQLGAEIEYHMRENELLISRWSPLHLHTILQRWFWKDDQQDVLAQQVWQQFAQQLYLPRLLNDQVFQETLSLGSSSTEYFALAQGKEGGRYVDFNFGQSFQPIFDASLLLIEPVCAQAYDQALKAKLAQEKANASKPTQAESSDYPSEEHVDKPDRAGAAQTSSAFTNKPIVKTQFFGSVEINPANPKMQFTDIYQDILQYLIAVEGGRVTLSLDVSAEVAAGFDETTQRTVLENAHTKQFKNASFE